MSRNVTARFDISVAKPHITSSLLPFTYYLKIPPSYEDGIFGADYEARTRYLHLGKVALYQMS